MERKRAEEEARRRAEDAQRDAEREDARRRAEADAELKVRYYEVHIAYQSYLVSIPKEISFRLLVAILTEPA